MTIRVSVAGGAPAWRRGMTAILEEAGYETATFTSVRDWKPGVGGSAVIAQIDQEGGADAIRKHYTAYPHIPLIAVVEDSSVAPTAHLIRAGAAAVLDEGEDTTTFPEVLGAALHNRTSLPTRVIRSMAQTVPNSQDLSDWITDDEATWLRAMANGQTVGEVADDLGYSERAMFRMLRALYIRLGVKSRTEALVWASRNGVLIEPE